MFFKIKVIVPDVSFPTNEPINLQKVGQNKNIDIVIRRIKESEVENAPSFYQTICEAIADVKPSKNAAPIIDALLEKKLPDDYDLSSLPAQTRETYEKTGVIERYEIPKSSLPNSVQNLLDETYKILGETIHKVLGVASWKFAQNAPIYTYRYGRMLWSADGVDWKMSPVDLFRI